MAGSVDGGMGAGVAVAVGVGAEVGDGVSLGGGALGDGAGVSVSGTGVNVGADSAPAWGEGAAVAVDGVAWPGDCANEVGGWYTKYAHPANSAAPPTLATLSSVNSQQPTGWTERPCLFSTCFALMARIILICPAKFKLRRPIAG